MVEVTSWRGTGSFHPVLTARVAAPRDIVVTALAGGLRGRGLRLSYQGQDGFRATYRSLFDVLGWLELDFFGFTRLRVTVVADGTGSHVTVAVEDDRASRAHRVVPGRLQGAFRDLELQGCAVAVSGWQRPE